LKVSIFWHRRDLRVDDNAGLFHALNSAWPVQPIFIFDTEILSKLEDKNDARVNFIHQSLVLLNEEYQKHKGSLKVYYGNPTEVWKKVLEDFDVAEVYTNRDYEPYAQQRDQQIYELLINKNISFKGFKDHVIFEKREITKDDGLPYTIFTPYSKKWKLKLTPAHFKSYDTLSILRQLNPYHFKIPLLKDIGFGKTHLSFPFSLAKNSIIKNYHQNRDIPSLNGTSRLGVHLRFGTISIRRLASQAQGLNEVFLNELIWRDFYSMILYNFPHVVSNSFKPLYDKIKWRNNENEFEAWCNGKTGYPIVDAGMRELNTTGHMHNRLRMITASFLIKHLLIDWRWGEAYFAQKLLDFDLASNNGGWQWAASSGCDAAPYFRIFNPYEQTKRFDPQLCYIKTWVPELNSDKYPQAIVEHAFARKRVLETYAKALKND
jgi:deoxyribodipyrimidine photo-lyase